MSRAKLLLTVVVLATFAFVFSPAATASDFDKKTILTFSQPVEIPGVGAQVLPAGTYVFRLVNAMSGRDIVQVLNKEENHVYATILTIANERLKATGETVIRFRERPAGAPQALRAWFYPGTLTGFEFVYPKARAIEIAKEVGEPVLTMPSELAPQIVAPVPKPNEPRTEALMEAPVRAVEPSGREVEIAELKPPPALPTTASNLPLLALIGFGSIVLASGISFMLKRTA